MRNYQSITPIWTEQYKAGRHPGDADGEIWPVLQHQKCLRADLYKRR